MRSRRVTIADVAAAAGVSTATVSNYLNGRYANMSAATRQRIADVIRQLDYRPNVFAQGLKGQRSRSIGVVVLNIGYPFCTSIIRALSHACNAHHYQLLVCESGEHGERERKIIQSLLAQQADGLVIQATGANTPFLADIAQTLP
ncbi:MAG: LacI family transcriptional regulator, partial [Alicyclobacillus sp.]|nr:LacI family transcriptional regulator [Alicyclobacillus sp.]